VDWVHEWWTTAWSHGPPWTGSGTNRRALGRGGALTGVGPLTRGMGARRRGRKMEDREWGSRFGPHQGSGGGVVAERRR
jgi:hypothetical protein